jgi:histidyl-tRNA synthetase
LEEESRATFEKIKNSLNLLCVNFVEDKNLVRGLDYYQGLVFEFVSSALGSQDAFCGGGHYELAKKFEQKEEVQSIGAAIGIGRLMLLFDAAMQEQLMTAKKQDLCVVLPLTSEQNEISIHTADHLRENEIKAVVILEELSIKSKMKKANKADAKFVIIIGQEEQEKNSATLKNMQSGHEELVLLTGLPAKLHSTSC